MRQPRLGQARPLRSSHGLVWQSWMGMAWVSSLGWARQPGLVRLRKGMSSRALEWRSCPGRSWYVEARLARHGEMWQTWLGETRLGWKGLAGTKNRR